MEKLSQSKLFSIICLIVRYEAVSSFLLFCPFPGVSSAFPLTDDLDQPLLYPVAQHPPQPLARVGGSQQGSVDVVPPLLDVPDVLPGLYDQTVPLGYGGVPGQVEFIIDVRPCSAGEGGVT